MGLADELKQLEQLHNDGTLDYGEFVAAKDALIKAAGKPADAPQPGLTTPTDTTPPPPMPAAPQPAPRPAMTPERQEAATRELGMLLHLSLLLGLLIPFAGFIAALLIWQLKKEELPGIDPHGRNAMNWIISALIYAVVSAILCLIFIGVLGLVALFVCGIVFPIMAGVKANNGEVWRYPLAIEFIKPPAA